MNISNNRANIEKRVKNPEKSVLKNLRTEKYFKKSKVLDLIPSSGFDSRHIFHSEGLRFKIIVNPQTQNIFLYKGYKHELYFFNYCAYYSDLDEMPKNLSLIEFFAPLPFAPLALEKKAFCHRSYFYNNSWGEFPRQKNMGTDEDW